MTDRLDTSDAGSEGEYEEQEEKDIPAIWQMAYADRVGQIVQLLTETEDPDEATALVQTVDPGTGKNLLLWGILNQHFVFVEWLMMKFGVKAAAIQNTTALAIADRWREEHAAAAEREDDRQHAQPDEYAEEGDPEDAVLAAVADAFASEEKSLVALVGSAGWYEGGRDADNARDGHGASIYPNGDWYVGEYRGGRRHGAGAYVWLDATPASDEVPDDSDAPATALTAHTRIYVGAWRDNVPHGTGRMVYPDGSRYLGAFVDAQRGGTGTLTAPNGDMYAGDWENDERHGRGVLRDAATGGVFVGAFRGGSFIGGRWVQPDGTVYFGNFSDGAPSGHGCFVFGRGGGVAKKDARAGGTGSCGRGAPFGLGADGAAGPTLGGTVGAGYRVIGRWTGGDWQVSRTENIAEFVPAELTVALSRQSPATTFSYDPPRGFVALTDGARVTPTTPLDDLVAFANSPLLTDWMAAHIGPSATAPAQPAATPPAEGSTKPPAPEAPRLPAPEILRALTVSAVLVSSVTFGEDGSVEACEFSVRGSNTETGVSVPSFSVSLAAPVAVAVVQLITPTDQVVALVDGALPTAPSASARAGSSAFGGAAMPLLADSLKIPLRPADFVSLGVPEGADVASYRPSRETMVMLYRQNVAPEWLKQTTDALAAAGGAGNNVQLMRLRDATGLLHNSEVGVWVLALLHVNASLVNSVASTVDALRPPTPDPPARESVPEYTEDELRLQDALRRRAARGRRTAGEDEEEMPLEEEVA